MAGFECTYALAEKGRRFDLLSASKHDTYCQADYAMIKEVGMETVREGFSWSGIDKGSGHYDFSRFEPMLQAAKEEGIEQIWDLNHFDFPEDLDPFTTQFPARYAAYAKQCLKKIREYHKGPLYITPMNEPSFFSWMCDNGLWAPYAKGKGTEFKRQLVRAVIAAMDAIWEEDSTVQFIHTDPYMYRAPLRVKNEKEKAFCDDFNTHVKTHSWDMLAGIVEPELGGDPKYIGFLGVNYYFYNQQFVGINEHGHFSYKTIPLAHKKRLSLAAILHELYERYHTKMILAETGSYRKRRTSWWTHILGQVDDCLAEGLPLYGVCSYPTLDITRGSGFIVPQSGLWDFDCDDTTCQRIPHTETLAIISSYTKRKKASSHSITQSPVQQAAM